jgi:Holliday junction DNA helicase RuvA
VGFALRTTATSLSGLRQGQSEEVTFLTHMNVREDAIELFGFVTAHELNCFKMLLSISGVGPKAALSILSAMSPQGFALSVVADDVKSLTAVPGIGAKTAQMIILKLKDKIGKEQGSGLMSGSVPAQNRSGGAGTTGAPSAVSALLVLGFSAGEAAAALSGAPDDLDTSEKIKYALKKLSKK